MTAHDLAATLRDVGNLTVLDTVAAYAVDGRRPAVVVRPHDSASVCTLLRHCATWELAVIPCGGRTDIALGNAPEAYQVALDMTTLDRIVEHRPRDLSVTVEAGMTFAALDQALAPHGQIVGLDPPCPERATVGGVLAANASGPRRHRFGTARDHVIGISAVLANGDQVKSGGRVVKNVAGYDLAKLFIGSAGALAVITSATFRLYPAPPGAGIAVASFPDAAAAQAAALTVAAAAYRPLSLDLISPPAAATLLDALPSGCAAGWLVIAEVAGGQATVERTLHGIVRALRDGGGDAVEGNAHAAARLHDRVRDLGAALPDGAAALRVASLPSQVAAVCAHIEEAMPHGASPAIVARAGAGVTRAYVDGLDDAQVITLVERLRRELALIGGIVVVERGSAAVKEALDVWGISGGDVTLMRRTKRAFDPQGILSPGRGPARL